MLKFINAIASLNLGRQYLSTGKCRCIKKILLPTILNEQRPPSNVKFDMLIATLQKLSLEGGRPVPPLVIWNMNNVYLFRFRERNHDRIGHFRVSPRVLRLGAGGLPLRLSLGVCDRVVDEPVSRAGSVGVVRQPSQLHLESGTHRNRYFGQRQTELSAVSYRDDVHVACASAHQSGCEAVRTAGSPAPTRRCNYSFVNKLTKYYQSTDVFAGPIFG